MHMSAKTLNKRITVILLLCFLLGSVYHQLLYKKSSPNKKIAAASIENQPDTSKNKYGVKISSNYKWVLTNPDSTLALVNKERNLPANYIPSHLKMIYSPYVNYLSKGNHEKNKVREIVQEPLVSMLSKAEKDGITLCIASAYRSYKTQKKIFTYNTNQEGEKNASLVSAEPGQSEHQTGLAIDFTSASVNFGLISSFDETQEGKWLAKNAYKYGFILRYPKDETVTTGYEYEPWHYRYVGVEAASAIYKKYRTFENYYNRVILKKS